MVVLAERIRIQRSRRVTKVVGLIPDCVGLVIQIKKKDLAAIRMSSTQVLYFCCSVKSDRRHASLGPKSFRSVIKKRIDTSISTMAHTADSRDNGHKSTFIGSASTVNRK